MGRIFAFMLGNIVGGALVFGSAQYHVVRTNDGFRAIARQKAGWHDIYSDVRGWTAREWSEHQELGRDATLAGHGALVPPMGPGEFISDIFAPLRNSLPLNGNSRRDTSRD